MRSPLLLALAATLGAADGAATMPLPGADQAVAGGPATAVATSDPDAPRWRARVQAAGGIAPAPYRTITGERQRISTQEPKAWAAKTKLQALKPLAPGALDPASLVITHRGRTLAVGGDVRLDPVWGGLGLAPGASIGPDDEVELAYRVALRRVDALVRTADGREVVRSGDPHLLTPLPPALAPGEVRLAGIFVDHHQAPDQAAILPVLGAAAAPAGTTSPERLPATIAKLRAGQPVTIVCWGDSVTEGGDVDRDARYGAQLAASLRTSHPQVRVEVVAVGGSNSRQWTEADLPAARRHPTRQADCRFERVLEARPDLVVIEFVNDQGLGEAAALAHYGAVIARLRAAGAEVLLLTPQRNWDRDGTLREPDRRGLVAAYRRLGREGAPGVGTADMAGRWEQLWREGIPFPTLLANGYNHPDARGHRLFAEEIRRALGLTPGW